MDTVLATVLESGRSYHVSLRGQTPGESSCSCPDFRTNQLGVCKHVFRVLDQVGKRFKPKRLSQAYQALQSLAKTLAQLLVTKDH